MATLKELIEELDNNTEEAAITAYIDIIGEEYATADGFEESFQGKWDSDEEFVQQLIEDCGDLPKDLPSYIYIDWEHTARDIMMDYSKSDGFYFRNV